MKRKNPFDDAAAEGAGEDAVDRLEWQREQAIWAAHVDACEAIMRNAILPRMQLACEAVNQYGDNACVTGVFQTQTHTGVLHLRVKLEINAGSSTQARLEFIGSPKSMVIATEGNRWHTNKRWGKIAFSADAISTHADAVISDFLKWRG
jgi:hypothetical protein